MNVQFQLYVVLVAISTLTLIAIGASVTSQANVPQPTWHPILDANVHRVVAIAVGFLGLGLAVWQLLAEAAPFLGWTALAFFVVDVWVGLLGGPVVLHATLAPLAFASFVAIAVVTSSGWKEPPELADAQAAPLLRPLAIASPPLLLLQTVLGATYRHKLTGLMPHMGGAMIVSLATLLGSMLVMQHYPKHRTLRPAAIGVMIIILAQVTLGFAAFFMQVLELGNSLARVISTASHVVMGSLAMAASLVLAMQVQRHVRRSASGPTAESTSREVASENDP